MSKKLLKILTYVAFGIAAVFMVIAVSLCVKHLIWNSKGEKVTANYVDNHISYVANKVFQYEELPTKYNKYVDENNKISIIYDQKHPEKFYCVKSISNVFIFAGIGFVFLIGTFALYMIQNKKPKEKKVEEDSTDSNDDIVMVRVESKNEESK